MWQLYTEEVQRLEKGWQQTFNMGRVKNELHFAAVENMKCHSQAVARSTNYDLLQTEKKISRKLTEQTKTAFLNVEYSIGRLFLDSVWNC